MKRLFELTLVARLLFPFFDSPLSHIYSDPQRHWDNAQLFLHPGIMGSSDPFLYQAWLFTWRWLSHDQAPVILLSCGILCAAMPYGWYRALRELLPRPWALGGAMLIAVIPESISLYAYFMNETLLMALLGFCFWFALRSYRKRTVRSYALACVAFVCAALTRTVALPMALGCLGWVWLWQQRHLQALIVAVLVAAILIIPAGLRAQGNLGFFAPFGNLYFNSVYYESANRNIAVDYGRFGRFEFGSPSFYNPTYYPFSQWTTDRRNTASITIDTRHGRADWLSERARIRAQANFPRARQRWEDFQYLLFSQVWPNSDHSTFIGQATVWSRWVWAPLIGVLSWGVTKRRFRGIAWLLPICGLGTVALLAFQFLGVTEARFREPVDAILVAAAICLLYLRSGAALPERVHRLQLPQVQQ